MKMGGQIWCIRELQSARNPQGDSYFDRDQILAWASSRNGTSNGWLPLLWALLFVETEGTKQVRERRTLIAARTAAATSSSCSDMNTSESRYESQENDMHMHETPPNEDINIYPLKGGGHGGGQELRGNWGREGKQEM